MAAVAPVNVIQCMTCTRIDGLPLPGDSALHVRFCLAEWPNRLCMYCCTCTICMRVSYSQEGLFRRMQMSISHFLYLSDDDFKRYCSIEDEL